MYSDIKKKKLPVVLLVAVPLVLALIMVLAVFRGSSQDMTQQGADAIRDAVQRSALQCYVVEGVYPPSLEYLEENYGLKVNQTDYYVTYEAFASNQPPTVLVTVRKVHGGE